MERWYRPNGYGTFENKEDVVISGEFENGNPQGKITIISSSKKYLNNVEYLESKLQTDINEVKIVGIWRNEFCMMVLRCISMENYFKKNRKVLRLFKTPFSVVFKSRSIYCC